MENTENKMKEMNEVDKKLGATAIDIDLTLNALGVRLLENDEKVIELLTQINENGQKTNERIKKLTEAMLLFVDALKNKIDE